MDKGLKFFDDWINNKPTEALTKVGSLISSTFTVSEEPDIKEYENFFGCIDN